MKSTGFSLAFISILAASLLILAGCGSGSIGSTPVPPPTLNSVSVKPANMSVAPGASQQYNAMGSYSDGTLKDLTASATWTSSVPAAATITSAGLAKAIAAGTTVISASSGSVTGSTNMTVTPVSTCGKVGTIDAVDPVSFYFDDQGVGTTKFTLTGTCFAAGQILHIDGYADAALPSGVSPTEIVEIIPIATPGYSPRWIKISLASADGTVNSNTVAIAFVGNQNTLALDAGGNMYQLDQAQGFPTTAQNGFVRKFKADGTANGSFNVGGNARSIAFDDADSLVFVGTGAWDVNGAPGGGGNDGVATMGVAVSGGMLCGAQPDANQVFSFLASQTKTGNPTFHIGAAGQQPWSVATTMVGGEPDCMSFDVEGKQLMRFRISDMTQQGIALLVDECTAKSQLPYATGGWQLAVLNDGSAGGLLCRFDKKLILFDPATMTITNRVTLTGDPFRIAVDNKDGDIRLANADQAAITTRYSKVNPSTAAVTPLAITSDLLSVGFAVSPDGTKLDVCQQEKCVVLDNK